MVKFEPGPGRGEGGQRQAKDSGGWRRTQLSRTAQYVRHSVEKTEGGAAFHSAASGVTGATRSL